MQTLRRFSCEIGSSIFCFEFQLSVKRGAVGCVEYYYGCLASVGVMSPWIMLIGFVVYTLFLLRVVIFSWMLSGCPYLFFVVFPKSLWACRFALGGGCGRQGTSGMHPRGSHYLIIILMLKRILLLALIPSRTAAVGLSVHCYFSVFGLDPTSWVGPGKRVTPRVCACVFPST